MKAKFGSKRAILIVLLEAVCCSANWESQIKYFIHFILLATLLNSRTPRQFLEKREVESKKKKGLMWEERDRESLLPKKEV